MNIDQYYQRQHCKHVEFEQFLACFHVARVRQRQLGFLVTGQKTQPTVSNYWRKIYKAKNKTTQRTTHMCAQ